MEEKVSQMNDPVFDEVNEKTRQDQMIAERCTEKLADIIKEQMDNDPEFNVKHGFLALGRTIIYLSQTFCKDAQQFEFELEKSNALAVDKMMASLMPTMKDGKIVDENFDMEDVSLRRVLMATGSLVDYTFWRNELSQYAERRAQMEADNQANEEAATESISVEAVSE